MNVPLCIIVHSWMHGGNLLNTNMLDSTLPYCLSLRAVNENGRRRKVRQTFDNTQSFAKR